MSTIMTFFVLALVSLAAGGPIPIRRSSQELQSRQTVVTDFSGGTGDATYYATGLGACGITNVDTDFIAAIGEDFFDQYAAQMGDSSGNPNNNPICNKQVVASWGGNSVTVSITDRCAGCTIPYSLDFSPAAFQQLSPLEAGRLNGMTWVWADGGSSPQSTSPPASSSSSDAWAPSAPATTPSSSSSDTWTPPASATTSPGWSWTNTTPTSTTPTATWTSASTGTPSVTGSASATSPTTTPSGGVNAVNPISSGSTTSTPSASSTTASSTSSSWPSKQSSGARRSIRRLWEL